MLESNSVAGCLISIIPHNTDFYIACELILGPLKFTTDSPPRHTQLRCKNNIKWAPYHSLSPMCFWLYFLEMMFYGCSFLLMAVVVRRAENLLFYSLRFSESELQGLKYNPEAYEMPVNTHIVCFSYLRHGKPALSWDTNIFQTAWESCMAADTRLSQESKTLILGMEEGQTIEMIKKKACKSLQNNQEPLQ